MVKRIVMMVCAAGMILSFGSNAFALTWFWGTDADVTYAAAAESGTYWLPVPFTVVSDGDNLVGASLPPPYVNGAYSPAVRTDSNMGGYWGVYYGTTLIPTGLAIAVMPGSGYDFLPDGVYTSDDALKLNYWSVSDPTMTKLLSVASLNSYRITIGDEPQTSAVPEPATALLLSTGLLGGVFWRKRRG